MSEEEKPKERELKKISKEELDEILKAHAKWVEEGCDPEKPGRADLSKTFLQGLKLENANLQAANLEGAWLGDTRLRNANLKEANLFECGLPSANLQEAMLDDANLQKAVLFKASLQNAVLHNVNLQEADLYSANLQEAILFEARLQKANLFRADLQKAWLQSAKLQGSNLTEANLTGAYLHEAKLRGAILRHTNLSGALHLDVHELEGMDLYSTILPQDLAKFGGLKTVDEAAKKGSHLFTTLLLGCLFAWLSVGFGVIAPKDGGYSVQSLTLNESGFLVLAPAFILALFFYFQMYLQRLWEQLALMPAIFPDGSPLDKKAHPWLPIGYVRAHVKVLRANRPPMSKLQTVLIQATVFWAAPASVALFWVHGLQRGEASLGIVWQAALTWLACLIAEAFIYQARHTLRREDPPPYRDRKKSLRQRVAAFLDHHTWAAARLFIYAELLVGLTIRLWPS